MKKISALAAAVVALCAVSSGAHANLVTNGGFESGDFTGWVQSGNATFNGVECPGAGLVAEGACDAFFGPVGSNSTLSQDIATQAGGVYSISFDFKADGGTPSIFSADFGGSLLTSLVNPPGGLYSHFSFLETATGPTTTLQFTFRDDPGFLNLDDVRVEAPEPLTLSLFGAGLVGAAAMRRRKKASSRV